VQKITFSATIGNRTPITLSSSPYPDHYTEFLSWSNLFTMNSFPSHIYMTFSTLFYMAEIPTLSKFPPSIHVLFVVGIHRLPAASPRHMRMVRQFPRVALHFRHFPPRSSQKIHILLKVSAILPMIKCTTCPRTLSYPGSSLDLKYKEAEIFTARSSKFYLFRVDLWSPDSEGSTLSKLGVGRFRFTPFLKPS
jgi:hypothetical protein